MLKAQKKILVAEDNLAMSVVVRYNLQRAGFDVTAVTSGEDAWDKLQAETYDLLITDYQMPVLDGIELCKRLQKSPQHRGMLIFMLTAKFFELPTEYLKNELGVTISMPKPFSPVELVQAVQQYLEPAAVQQN